MNDGPDSILLLCAIASVIMAGLCLWWWHPAGFVYLAMAVGALWWRRARTRAAKRRGAMADDSWSGG